MTEKFYLTYPKDLIKAPLIYLVGQQFHLVTNIRGANVSDEMGLVALEVEGEQARHAREGRGGAKLRILEGSV